ncbi:hypothetical protein [Spirulina sp. 06S082]|uniref:hypothetical protein n=1 Tax=Spirulina sp. 06S082 TaxID=3110248 RepID=UPI002B213A5D|nr:hypothetical protein [Spirulina sp. 06S082]
MRFPRWFPYPQCWLRVAIISLSTTIGVFVVNAFFNLLTLFFSAFFNLLTLFFSNANAPVVHLVLSSLLLLISIGRLVGVFWFHTVVCQWVAISQKQPVSWSWIPPKQFWYESLIDWIIWISSGLFVFFVYASPAFSDLREGSDMLAEMTQIASTAFVFAVFLMAYIHQARFLAFQYWGKKKRKRKEASQSARPRVKRLAQIVQDDEPRQRQEKK